MVTWVPSASSGLQITFGKFDSPLAIERDDAPLNFQATESFTFDFARPVKFTGLQVHEAFSERFELWGILTNGWDVDHDNNKAKTGALYGMWSPSLAAHVGLGVIYGPEKDDRTSDARRRESAPSCFSRPRLWLWGASWSTVGAALIGGGRDGQVVRGDALHPPPVRRPLGRDPAARLHG